MNFKHLKGKKNIKIFITIVLILLCVVGIFYVLYSKRYQFATEPSESFPESFEYNDFIDNNIVNSIR